MDFKALYVLIAYYVNNSPLSGSVCDTIQGSHWITPDVFTAVSLQKKRNWITMCEGSVRRCPPLITQTIGCGNWIMESIASTYQEVSHSKRGPLLIQSHPSVQRSMILLIFTNVFVAVIDFFPACVVSHKENSLRSEPEFHFLSTLYETAALCSICRVAAELLCLGPCSRVERLCCTCLSSAHSGTNDKHLDSAYGEMTAGEEHG